MRNDYLRNTDDYLWDAKSAAASDPQASEIAALERSLARFRAPSAEAMPLAETVWEDREWQSARPSAWRESLAIAAVFAIALGGAWLSLGRNAKVDGANWQASRITGNPQVGHESVGERFNLRSQYQ